MLFRSRGEGKVQIRKKTGSTGGSVVQSKQVNSSSLQKEIYSILVNGIKYDVQVMEGEMDISTQTEARSSSRTDCTVEEDGINEIRAGISGSVLRSSRAVGDPIREGDVVMVLESMKMEIEIKSPFTGRLQSILVKEGDQVAEGDLLLKVGA